MKKKIIKITVMTLAMIISIGVGFIINTTDEETFKIVDNKDTYTGNQILGMISKILILNNLGKDW